MAISVSEVTDVDRRVGRRLGMDAEKVNMVLNVWAEEYLKLEMENTRLADATPAPRPPAKKAAAKKAAPAKKATASKPVETEPVGSPS